MGRIHERLGVSGYPAIGRRGAFDARSVLLRKRAAAHTIRYTTRKPQVDVKKLINFTIVAPNVPMNRFRLGGTRKAVTSRVGRVPRSPTVKVLYQDDNEYESSPRIERSRIHYRGMSGPSTMFVNAMKEAQLDQVPYEPVRPAPISASARLGPNPAASNRMDTGDTAVKGVRLLFTNLATTVSDDDVQELCSSITGLLHARLIEPGLAEAVYSSRKAAEEAVNLYDKRQLDGVPMSVRIVEAAKPKKAPAVDAKKGTKSAEFTIDRDLITSALFPQSKEQDGIAFTVKI